jgi:hypothetical protein
MRSLWLCALLILSASPEASHAERLQVCYSYDCSARSEIEFSEAELKEVRTLFLGMENAVEEREAAARAVGMFYLLAGAQSPIWQDHGENDDDEEVLGRMDCIDHSLNTTEFLSLMQRRGWLRFHHVASPVRRGFWNAHWGAHVVEVATGEAFVIDSWFYDPGEPAVVFALESWRTGARPPEDIRRRQW